MKIFRFYEADNTLSLRPDSFDDLYLLARIITAGDNVEAESKRRFKPAEGDIGEQKDVYIKLAVEKVELDKAASQLRFTGKILNGRPEKYVQIGSYHTINIGAGDELKIQKGVWKNYMIRRLREAVEESKRIALGVVVLDDEKALLAYIRGYGIESIAEIYSHLSKRMSQKDFKKQEEEYFKSVLEGIRNMRTTNVVVAGPGFTKDNIRRYIEEMGIGTGKQLLYVHASSAERSGIREAIQDPKVTASQENERVKNEFVLLNKFLDGLGTGASSHGPEGVRKAIEESKAGIVIVNDDAINRKEVQDVLDLADKMGVRIEILNANGEAGGQLRNFKDIACIPRSML